MFVDSIYKQVSQIYLAMKNFLAVEESFLQPNSLEDVPAQKWTRLPVNNAVISLQFDYLVSQQVIVVWTTHRLYAWLSIFH